MSKKKTGIVGIVFFLMYAMKSPLLNTASFLHIGISLTCTCETSHHSINAECLIMLK
jgi:hypothetical protein